jgi:hypothetical protein
MNLTQILMANPIQPTLQWYKAQSKQAGVFPRCPFAALKRCPRFLQSVALPGEGGLTTALQPDEDRRLLELWKKSDLWPRTNEHATAVMGPA